MLWGTSMGFLKSYATGNSNIYNFVKTKKLLGVKKSTQNDFLYGEFGSDLLKNDYFRMIINYRFKILESEQIKYIRYAYQLMMTDIEIKPDCVKLGIKVKRSFVKSWFLWGMVKSMGRQ